MTKSKKLFLSAFVLSALAAFPYAAVAAESDYSHAEGEAHKEGEHEHGQAHGDESHFKFDKPNSAEEAWSILDQSLESARKAIEAKDFQGLHEAGEKISAAVSALHDNPMAVKEENGEKLTSALDQLSKTADRFHHDAEKSDLAAATQTLDLLEGQKNLTRSLYPEPSQVEP